jgi:hypothetical protein
MDSRLFYTVFRHALRSIAWDKYGENEYILVGDGIDLDQQRLQSLLAQTFAESAICYPESRGETLEFAAPSAAAFIAARIQPKGAITVSDSTASIFLQVHSMGVARTGRAQANNSFKPNPLRGSA